MLHFAEQKICKAIDNITIILLPQIMVLLDSFNYTFVMHFVSGLAAWAVRFNFLSITTQG